MKKYIKIMTMISLLTSLQALFPQESKRIVTLTDDDIFRLYDRQYPGVSSCFNMLNEAGVVQDSFEDFVEQRLDENKINSLNVINEAQDVIFEKMHQRLPLIFSDRSETFEQISDPVFQALILHRDDLFMKHELKRIFDTPIESLGLTNIQIDVKNAHLKEVKMFAALGADLQVKDIHGNSLLHLAAQTDNEFNNKIRNLASRYQLHKDHDAFIALQTKQLKADYAKKISNLHKIALFLLDKGLDPNMQNNDQETPLHIIAVNGSGAMAKLLLDHGADVTLKDRFDNSALQIASLHDNANVVDQLISHGAKLPKKGTLSKKRKNS